MKEAELIEADLQGEARQRAPADDAFHVLIVDDDRRIRDLLSRFLAINGFRISTAEDAAAASATLAGLHFDLIILDVMMPGEDGFSFAARLRETSDVPILMLTALADVNDRIRGLEIGVDDYLAKPFDPRELLLRVNAILRRFVAPPPGSPQRRVTFGPYSLLLPAGELSRGEVPVRLTEREREILRLLAEAAGESVSREVLAGSSGEASERAIDVQINRLRRKIELDPSNPAFLQTARGSGYRLVTDASE